MLGAGDGEVVAVEWVNGGVWFDELDSSELFVCVVKEAGEGKFTVKVVLDISMRCFCERKNCMGEGLNPGF